MRWITLVVGSMLMIAGLSGCSGDEKPKAQATPTYELERRSVRYKETPLPGRRAQVGEMQFAVLGMRTGFVTITGSHAEVTAKGQWVRLRFVVANLGRDVHDFDTTRQVLVTADGQSHKLSQSGMNVRRQPYGKSVIGSENRLELDLWYDIPATAVPQSLHVFGDPFGSGLAGQGDPSPGSTAREDASISLKG